MPETLSSIDIDNKECLVRSNSGSNQWILGNRKIPRSELVYFSTFSLFVVVIIISLVNISLKNGTETYWAAMAASCIG